MSTFTRGLLFLTLLLVGTARAQTIENHDSETSAGLTVLIVVFSFLFVCFLFIIIFSDDSLYYPGTYYLYGPTRVAYTPVPVTPGYKLVPSNAQVVVDIPAATPEAKRASATVAATPTRATPVTTTTTTASTIPDL